MTTETIILRLGVHGDCDARHLMAYDGPVYKLWDEEGLDEGALRPLCGQPGDYYQMADYVLTRARGLCRGCLAALIEQVATVSEG